MTFRCVLYDWGQVEIGQNQCLGLVDIASNGPIMSSDEGFMSHDNRIPWGLDSLIFKTMETSR